METENDFQLDTPCVAPESDTWSRTFLKGPRGIIQVADRKIAVAPIVLLCGGMLSTHGILPTNFVALGPFRYVRNPKSLGTVTMMSGLALSYRSVSILLVAAVLLLALHGIVVFVEEPGLEKRFGESYLQYKHRVNRWVSTFRYRPDTNHP